MSFFHTSSQARAGLACGMRERGDDYPCTVLQWVEVAPGQYEKQTFEIVKACGVASIKDSPLTIIIAPIDEAREENLAGLNALTSRFRIPPTFIDECDRFVVNSFGYREDHDGSVSSWLHFLLKEIETEGETAEIRVQDDTRPASLRFSPFRLLPSIKGTKTGETSGRHAPFDLADGGIAPFAQNWSKCSFFIRAEKPSGACDYPNGSLEAVNDEANPSTGSSTASVVPPQAERQSVTLICFGIPAEIDAELQALSDTPSIDHILRHPFMLWELILYHLSVFLDSEMWNLTRSFHTEQHDLGYLTAQPSKSLSDIDFSKLHVLADHIILILEGANGLLASMDGLISHHETEFDMASSSLVRRTRQALKYRQRFIQSIAERGLTFDKRVSNMISLFFHQVALQDSGIVMRDSTSLKSVALLTAFFLPITTIATICGSEFFYTSDSDETIQMNPAGWVMFGVSGIVTAILVGAWIWQVKKLEKRFARGKRQVPQMNMTSFDV